MFSINYHVKLSLYKNKFILAYIVKVPVGMGLRLALYFTYKNSRLSSTYGSKSDEPNHRVKLKMLIFDIKMVKKMFLELNTIQHELIYNPTVEFVSFSSDNILKNNLTLCSVLTRSSTFYPNILLLLLTVLSITLFTDHFF